LFKISSIITLRKYFLVLKEILFILPNSQVHCKLIILIHIKNHRLIKSIPRHQCEFFGNVKLKYLSASSFNLIIRHCVDNIVNILAKKKLVFKYASWLKTFIRLLVFRFCFHILLAHILTQPVSSIFLLVLPFLPRVLLKLNSHPKILHALAETKRAQNILPPGN